ncbi:MAG: CRTAC1 family protein [bacterium]|nr:CRTAC1 family protein [bacterium]
MGTRSSKVFGGICGLLAGFVLASGTALGAVSYSDVTAASGIDFVGDYGMPFSHLDMTQALMQQNMGAGGAVDDYDDDGDLDVYLVGTAGHMNRLFRNNLDQGSATFSDVTASAGLATAALTDGLSRIASFADLDDDGDLDLVVVNDYDGDPNNPPNQLLRNNGNSTFTNVTAGSGFQPIGYLHAGMAMADYDRDGLLDIVTTDWTFEAGTGAPQFPGSLLLFRNLGGFKFQEVTVAAGLEKNTFDTFSALFADFNDDGWPDLHVAIDHTEDEFWVNNSGVFTRATDSVYNPSPHLGNDMGLTATDFDNDGDLDIYATNIANQSVIDLGHDRANVLWVNKFADESVLRFDKETFIYGPLHTYWGWGVEFTDVENDGDQDILAANGMDQFLMMMVPQDENIMKPMALMMNDGNQMYSRVTPTGMDFPQDSRGLVTFDYDRDGDEDALVTNVDEAHRLFANTSTDQGHYLSVGFVQKMGQNRNGVGVKVYATSGGVTRRRDLLSGDSFVSGTPKEVHIGLGASDTLDELHVEWTDGTSSTYTDVVADRFITIHQRHGDMNRNAMIDHSDQFQQAVCRWTIFFNPSAPVSARCQSFDYDIDGDIDTDDTVAFNADYAAERARLQALIDAYIAAFRARFGL